MTCGSDGDFRVWAGLEDDDPSSQCVGEWALCVLCKENKLYLALDNNTVQSYTYPDCDKDTILLRFTAPASHLALGPKVYKYVIYPTSITFIEIMFSLSVISCWCSRF